MNTESIQQMMQQEEIDCWVIYDFQEINPILSQVLRTKVKTTRRVFLIIPVTGEVQILGSKIDKDMLREFPLKQNFYISWQEMEYQLNQLLKNYQVIALDYSHNGALPTVSRVDAGTVEMVKNLGKTIVSSANIFQAATAIWEESVLEAHLEDADLVAQIKDEAFQFIANSLYKSQDISEYDVQKFILQKFHEANLITEYVPIVAVNENSGKMHYIPNEKRCSPIKKGDWILIDLWAKRPQYECVFADMTWVAFAGTNPHSKHQEIFGIVKESIDKVLTFLSETAKKNISVEGWQVDDVARNYITSAGYGEYFVHRTGHSLSPGDYTHGSGVNIDNLETHDTRKLIQGVGFSIEPGIYLPEFGARLEINVYMDKNGPKVTTPIQKEIICLNV